MLLRAAIKEASDSKERVKALYIDLPELPPEPEDENDSGNNAGSGSDTTSGQMGNSNKGDGSGSGRGDGSGDGKLGEGSGLGNHGNGVHSGSGANSSRTSAFITTTRYPGDDGIEPLDLCNAVNQTALCYCDRLGYQGCHKTLFESYLRGHRSVIAALRALLGPEADHASAAVTMCKGLGEAECHEEIRDAVKNGTRNLYTRQ